MNTEDIKQLIVKNAEEIRRLHESVHEAATHRDKSSAHRERWQRTAREFRQRYDALAFPGGFDGAYVRILSGDSEAIEAALCFLEIRPYFFRSGYMYRALVAKVRHANLSKNQSERFNIFSERLAEWRQSRQRVT